MLQISKSGNTKIDAYNGKRLGDTAKLKGWPIVFFQGRGGGIGQFYVLGTIIFLIAFSFDFPYTISCSLLNHCTMMVSFLIWSGGKRKIDTLCSFPLSHVIWYFSQPAPHPYPHPNFAALVTQSIYIFAINLQFSQQHEPAVCNITLWSLILRKLTRG